MSEDAGARAAGGAALSPRVRAIVAIGLLGLLLGFLWGIADVPRYTASASVLVTSKGGEPAGEAELEAAAQLAQSAEVAAPAAGLIGGDVAGADLLSDIDVAADPSAGAVRIDADSDSPDFAAAAANGYALALVEVGGKRYEEGAQASIPDSPSEDRSAPLWALIGLLAGLLLGFAVTAVRSRTAGAEPAKPRPKAAPSAGESPAALARLGDPARLLVRSGEASEFNPAALGDLAAAAAALGLDDADGPRRVAAVGVGAGGGALEVLVGLAVLAGERGLRTILVEADLDAPVLAARTGEFGSVAEAIGSCLKPGKAVEPVKDWVGRYDELFQRYKAAYVHLKEDFAALAAIGRRQAP